MNENVDSGKITVIGNTVIDVLLDVVDDNYQFEDKLLNRIDFKNKKIILLTAHRRENFDQSTENIFDAVNNILKENSDAEVVYSVHLNPVIREFTANNLKMQQEFV